MRVHSEKASVRPNKFLDAALNHLDPRNTPLFTVEVLTPTSFCLFPPSKRWKAASKNLFGRTLVYGSRTDKRKSYSRTVVVYGNEIKQIASEKRNSRMIAEMKMSTIINYIFSDFHSLIFNKNWFIPEGIYIRRSLKNIYRV